MSTALFRLKAENKQTGKTSIWCTQSDGDLLCFYFSKPVDSLYFIFFVPIFFISIVSASVLLHMYFFDRTLISISRPGFPPVARLVGSPARRTSERISTENPSNKGANCARTLGSGLRRARSVAVEEPSGIESQCPPMAPRWTISKPSKVPSLHLHHRCTPLAARCLAWPNRPV